MAQPIMITLNKINAGAPCNLGWSRIVAARGGQQADHAEEFPLSFALDSNGLLDVVWAIHLFPEHDDLWRQYALWCADQVAYLMEDRHLKLINAAKLYSNREITYEELTSSRVKFDYRPGWLDDIAWATSSRSGSVGVGWIIGADLPFDSPSEWHDQRIAKMRQILDAGQWVD